MKTMQNLDYDNYFVSKYIMRDYIFVDIEDKRNGETYCFYKHRENDANYIFYRNYQAWDAYSKTEKITADTSKPFSLDFKIVAKKRPANPFDSYAEYTIEFTRGNLLLIKNIENGNTF